MRLMDTRRKLDLEAVARPWTDGLHFLPIPIHDLDDELHPPSALLLSTSRFSLPPSPQRRDL